VILTPIRSPCWTSSPIKRALSLPMQSLNRSTPP
jgi:hypothetical protein